MSLYKEGPGDRDPGKNLSYSQINNWSDWVEKKNLNSGKFEDAWRQFVAENPNTDINKDILKENLDRLNKTTHDKMKSLGFDSEYNRVELGSGLAFPMVIFNGQSYGRADANLISEKDPGIRMLEYPEKFMKKALPQSADLDSISYENGMLTWINQETGDLEVGSKDLLYKDPIIRRQLKKKAISQAEENGGLKINDID